MGKILIIGSNGYIGNPLKNILKSKHQLVLPSHKLSQIDVLKKNSLAKYIKSDIDIIINLSGQITKKKVFKKIIVDGNKNIIDLINRVNKEIIYIFFSTCLIYGHKVLPATEKSKLAPMNSYARLKQKAETYIKKKVNKFRILRLANVYDDNYKNGFFKKFFNDIRSKKKITFSNILTYRNLIHLNDAIKSVDYLIKNKKVKKLEKLIINVGNENIELSKIEKIFSSHFKDKLEINDKKISIKKDSSQLICTKKLNSIAKWRKKKISNTLLAILKKNEKYI
tara:strand:- start:400 stop:1242 length:843 start_codon:yes stop_codon:yes gene_type:complete